MVSMLKNGLKESYQSYHSGIETKSLGSNPAGIFTTNRTIVELKLNFIPFTAFLFSNYQSYHSGIETEFKIVNVYFNVTTNRTIVELKL